MRTRRSGKVKAGEPQLTGGVAVHALTLTRRARTSCPDMSRMLSGHPQAMKVPRPPRLPEGPWVWMGAGTNTALAGPWGVSYAVNLTPDELSGLGIWTEDMFVRALRTGRHMGVSRPILPPMPWQYFKNLIDEDLKAIYAYLRSIPPVRNHVPDPVEPGELMTAMK